MTSILTNDLYTSKFRRYKNFQFEILIVKPVISTEEDTESYLKKAVQALRMKKAVIFNCTYLGCEETQRMVDFLSGGTHALDGSQTRLCEKIFFFVPHFVHFT